MAKNREKQKAHKRCGLTRDERIMKEAEERQLSIKMLEKELQELKEEELEAVNYYGLKDPTPRDAVKRILRPERNRIMGELRRLSFQAG